MVNICRADGRGIRLLRSGFGIGVPPSRGGHGSPHKKSPTSRTHRARRYTGNKNARRWPSQVRRSRVVYAGNPGYNPSSERIMWHHITRRMACPRTTIEYVSNDPIDEVGRFEDGTYVWGGGICVGAFYKKLSKFPSSPLRQCRISGQKANFTTSAVRECSLIRAPASIIRRSSFFSKGVCAAAHRWANPSSTCPASIIASNAAGRKPALSGNCSAFG